MSTVPPAAVTFIAMSGVRIYNAELLALGMTLPGFIERGKVIASLPSLGVLTLAGLTPDDWQIEYVEIDDLSEDTLQRTVDRARGLVAISSLSARINDAYRLADTLRASGKTVAIGGLHASVLPDEVVSHADAVIVGEGESVWAEVLRDYRANQLKPLYKATRARTFDPWAVPRYHLLDPRQYNRITIQTTRGCPLDCSFCAASRLISHYKRKPLEKVEQELDAIEAIWPRPFIELADDNSFVHKAWSKELIRLLARRKLKWFTESDVSLADDDELLDEMAGSGCAQVLIGFEAIDGDALDETDTKHWKLKRRARYREAIAKIQSKGISVNGCFIFGFDHHGPDVFERTADFIEESELSEVQVTVLTPFPGTALYQRLRSEGRLLKPTHWDQCTLFDVAFRPARMTPAQLELGFRNLVSDIYSVEKTERRKTRFRSCVRAALSHG